MGHGKTCCLPASCSRGLPLPSSPVPAQFGQDTTCGFRAVELPQCVPQRPFPSSESVTVKLPLPDLLPVFPLPLKAKFASCIGRPGGTFLPTSDVGLTVFHHVILVPDTLMCILFSLKHINVKSNTAFSICASICNPMSQYIAYLYPITVCLLGT